MVSTNAIRDSRGDRIFTIIIHVLLILVLIVMLYPLIYVISASFSNPMAVLQGRVILFPKELTLQAYARVFRHGEIMNGYLNTLIYTLLGTAINVTLTVAAAYPLSRRDLVGRSAIMLMMTFTMFFSGGMIPTYLIYTQVYGLRNSIWAMVLPGAISVYNTVIVRTFFQSSIPGELHESAMLDGCGNLRMLVSIVLPLSMPVLAVISLYYAVGHWNQWFNALIYLTDKRLYPLQMVLRGILVQSNMTDMVEVDLESMSEQMLIGESIKFAVVVVSSLPIMILYPFLQRFFVKGVMVGALKG